MKRLIILLFSICLVSNAFGQIVDELVAIGFENVRTTTEDNTVYVSWEDNRFRSSFSGVSEALRSVISKSDEGKNIDCVVTRVGIPQLHLSVNSEAAAAYRNGTLEFPELVNGMLIDCDTDRSWSKLSSATKTNSASWKPDFVIYPQLGLDNTTFDVLYMYYINLAPALEMELWKGGKLTLQAIFPVSTNMKDYHKMVRPGFLTISQDFYLKNRFKLRLSAGNFDLNRAGGILDVNWRTKNGRLELGARCVASVQSIVTPGEGWTLSSSLRGSGFVYADYYIPRFSSEIKAQYIKYVYGDDCVRMDLNRHFGEYTIGLYAMYVASKDAENNFNGGFNFSIPLPGKKFMKNRGARIRPARDWGLEYSIKGIWNHDGLRNITKNVNSAVDEGDAGLYLEPDYIRHFVIKEYEKKNK